MSKMPDELRRVLQLWEDFGPDRCVPGPAQIRDPRTRLLTSTHRFLFNLLRGPAADLDHSQPALTPQVCLVRLAKCKDETCINPYHFAVSNRPNQGHMLQKRRNRAAWAKAEVARINAAPVSNDVVQLIVQTAQDLLDLGQEPTRSSIIEALSYEGVTPTSDNFSEAVLRKPSLKEFL